MIYFLSLLSDEDDFRDICRELVSIKAKYYELGVELGLPPGELDAIRKDHAVDQAFNEVILRWLRQQYNIARFGRPTWKRLVEAVESPIGGSNPSLAVVMATRHAPGNSWHARLPKLAFWYYLNEIPLPGVDIICIRRKCNCTWKAR